MIEHLGSPGWAWHMADLINAHRDGLRLIQYAVRLHCAGLPRSNADAWHALSAAILAAPQHCSPCQIVLPPSAHRVLGGGAASPSLAALSGAGWQVAYMRPGAPCHAKVVALRNSCVSIGSHNLTRASLTRTVELSFIVRDPRQTAELWQMCGELWARGVT